MVRKLWEQSFDDVVRRPAIATPKFRDVTVGID